MTAITAAQIEAKGQTQADEVLRDVPSVQIQSAPSGADIVIRGVGGNDTGGISADPAVSVFVDGVYSGQPAAAFGALYDVQRVEVLRGPQGTLYGRNSSGGAVNILTNDPEAKFAAGANVGAGNLNLRQADAFINLPATDTLAFRFAVDREKRDGYYSNDGEKVDITAARGKAKWTPSESFSLLMRADYWHSKNSTTTAPVRNIDPAASCDGPPCALFVSSNPSNPWNTDTASFSPFQVAASGRIQTFQKYSMQADVDLGIGTLTVIPSFSHNIQYVDNQGLFTPPAPVTIEKNGVTTNKQYTYEMRLGSPATSATKWVVGVYYLYDDAKQSGPPAGTPPFYAQQAPNHRPATSYAGFAQTTIPISNEFRATLGGRYTADKKTLLYGVCSSNDGFTCGLSPTGAGLYVSPASTKTNKYNSFTYKAGLEYDVTQSAMAYAQISTGYKAGGWSTAGSPPVAYLPEKLTNIELGIKSQLFDNRLQLNADVYLYQYKDQQLEFHPLLPYAVILPVQYIPDAYLPQSTSCPTCGTALATTPNTEIIDVNAGNSRYKGVEAQAKYQLTAHDQASVDVAYNRAVYGHFVVDTTGGPPGTSYTSQYFDLTGKQEAHAPLWSGNVGYQHAWDIGGGALTLQGNMRLQSHTGTTIQQWFADGNTDQKGYHQSDASLRYVAVDDKWSVGMWIKNIENNATVNYIYPLYRQTLDISRTYGANASIKF